MFMEVDTAMLNSKSVKMYKWNLHDFSVYNEETILYDKSKNGFYTKLLYNFTNLNVTSFTELVNKVLNNTTGDTLKRDIEIVSRNNRLVPYIIIKRLTDYSDAERMLPLSSAANVYN